MESRQTALPIDFIENKVRPLMHTRPEWHLENTSYGNYELDLKMCQLKALLYDFKWVDDR